MHWDAPRWAAFVVGMLVFASVGLLGFAASLG
jgi:hypothetical protein